MKRSRAPTRGTRGRTLNAWCSVRDARHTGRMLCDPVPVTRPQQANPQTDVGPWGPGAGEAVGGLLRGRALLGVVKCSGTGQGWWVHSSVNIPETLELYNLFFLHNLKVYLY